MRRLAILVLALFGCTGWMHGYNYVGVGNIQSGAIGYWGLRGYTTAFKGPVANICDVATGLTCADAVWNGTSLVLPSVTCPCNIAVLYDQSGAGYHLYQADNSLRPAYTSNCLGTKPCITSSFNGSLFTYLEGGGGSSYTLTLPFSFSAVSKRNAASQQWIYINIYSYLHYSTLGRIFWGVESDLVLPTDGASTDSLVGIAVAGTGTANLIINGTSNTFDMNTAAPSGGDALQLFAEFGGNGGASIFEIGFWPSNISANAAAIRANQQAYWGF